MLTKSVKKGGSMGKRKWIALVMSWILVVIGILTGCTVESNQAVISTDESVFSIEEDGIYSSKEDVALYIHTYGHLPSNYVTK